ncbi:GntR family transcriptional regulator [Paenibacillus fonticola]|uniref:GntR family transcriptional regulator n=1 Tax=Paenibacillus fonticola TaxID=379896 RepID=UPI00036055E5|nr:GntR family transcriptional regulator [Paenibacillus fonticola]
MNIDLNSVIPIYIQIADGIADDILNGILEEEAPAYSQYQIAKYYKINPATAAKGIQMLVAEGILLKKRGASMYVAPGAKVRIRSKRKEHFIHNLLVDVIREGKKLGFSIAEIKDMMDQIAEVDILHDNLQSTE